MSKDHARSHDENHFKVCLLCLGRTKQMFEIKNMLKADIEKLFPNYIDDERIPKVLCCTCKRKVYAVKSGISKELIFPDLSNFYLPKTRSRVKTKCSCHLCELALKSQRLFFPQEKKERQPLANVSNNVTDRKNISDVEKRCVHCFSIISRGVSHKCSSTSLVENLSACLCNSSQKEQDQIIASAIKKKTIEENVIAQSSTLQLCQRFGGKPLQITIGKMKENASKQPQISADDMFKIKSNLSLTDRATQGIASALRVATKNRKIIECGLKDKLKTKTHSVDQFFGCKEFNFLNITAIKVSEDSKTVICCTDLPALIHHTKEERKVSEVHLKIGIDGGGGFLKICLSIQSVENKKAVTRRSTYEEGVAAKRFKTLA